MQSALDNVLTMVTILAQANGVIPTNPAPPSARAAGLEKSNKRPRIRKRPSVWQLLLQA